jgi:hypothetical protein
MGGVASAPGMSPAQRRSALYVGFAIEALLKFVEQAFYILILEFG